MFVLLEEFAVNTCLNKLLNIQNTNIILLSFVFTYRVQIQGKVLFRGRKDTKYRSVPTVHVPTREGGVFWSSMSSAEWTYTLAYRQPRVIIQQRKNYKHIPNTKFGMCICIQYTTHKIYNKSSLFTFCWIVLHLSLLVSLNLVWTFVKDDKFCCKYAFIIKE